MPIGVYGGVSDCDESESDESGSGRRNDASKGCEHENDERRQALGCVYPCVVVSPNSSFWCG